MPIVHSHGRKKGKELQPGDEVIVGSGDHRQYATVEKVQGSIVYILCAGYKRARKFTASEIVDVKET